MQKRKGRRWCEPRHSRALMIDNLTDTGRAARHWLQTPLGRGPESGGSMTTSMPLRRFVSERTSHPLQAASPSASDNSDLRRSLRQPPTVLVVEDNPDHAEMVRVMLAHARGPRWAVTAVETRAEATTWLKQSKADVVLLDLNLPDSHGPQTAGLLCREYPELPVVVFTSLTDESASLDAMEQGAQDYLIKGQFEGVLLGRTLRLAIERKRAELAHARLAAIVENS